MKTKTGAIMILAFDPGKTGGICYLFDDGTVEVYKMIESRLDFVKNIEEAVEKNRQLSGSSHPVPVRAIVEQVNAMPSKGKGGKKVTMGATSAFSFGMQFEKIQMALSCLRISYELVRPQVWQKELGLNKKHNTAKEHKEFLRLKSMEMYPAIFDGQNLTYGRAVCDAVLIMEYGRRKRLDSFTNI